MSYPRWLSVFAVFLVLVVTSSNAFSQVTIGSTAGAGSVTRMGSAKFDIPIFTLPGYQDAAPQLILEYDSALSNANSQTGVGWRMSGVGQMIIRCAKTIANGDVRIQGPRYADDDVLCLSGSRLIRTSGTSNFAPGAEFEAEVQTTGMRAKVVFDGAHFTVFHQDGVVDRYAETLVENGVTVAWFTSTTTDPKGNVIEYEYRTPANNEAPLLEFINYAFDGSKFNHRVSFVYRDRPDIEVAFRNGVRINKTHLLQNVVIEKFLNGNWARKYSWRLGYDTFNFSNNTGNTSVSTRSRLASIQETGSEGFVKFPLRFEYNDDAAPANADKVTLRNVINTAGISIQDTLSLTFEDVDGDDIKDIVHIKMLSRVGGGATIPNPEDCIQTIQVDTYRSSQNYARVSSGVWGEFFPRFSVGGTDRDACRENPGWFALDQQGSGRLSPPLMEVHLIDVNNDQREDLVLIGFSNNPRDAIAFTFLNDGNGLFIVGDRGVVIEQPIGALRGSGGTPFGDNEYMEIHTADINGDGCEDIIKIFKSEATPGATGMDRWYNPCRSNTPGRFSQTDPSGVFHPAEIITPVWKDRDASDREFFSIFDLNGDSIPDLVIASLDTNGFVQLQHFINDGSGDLSNDSDPTTANPTATYSTLINWGGRGTLVETRILPADMNGDGLIDINGIQYAGSNLDNFVYFNPGKGDGTTPFVPGHVSRVAVNAAAGNADDTPRFLTLDWNDDNVSDLIRIFPNDDATQAGVALYLNDGSGVLPGDAITHIPNIISNNIGPWYNEPLSYIPNRNHYFVNDFNQDGLDGFIGLNWGAYERKSDTVDLRFYDSNEVYRSDLLVQVDDQTTGVQRQFVYVALAADPDVYHNDFETISAGTGQMLIPFNPGLWVVAQSSETYTATTPFYDYGTVTTNYQYSNLKADPDGRGIVGFDSFRQHVLQTDQVTFTRLNQFFPLTGLESLTQLNVGNVAITASDYGFTKVESAAEPNRFVYHVFPTQGLIINGHRSLNAIQRRTYDENLRLIQQIDISNVASSLILDSSMDAAEMSMSKLDSSIHMDGTEVIICTQFQYGSNSPDDPSIPRLGFPDIETELPSNSDCSVTNIVSEDLQRKTLYTYDSALNLTSKSTGSINDSTRRKTEFTYDNFGNLVQTIDARGNVTANGFGGADGNNTPANLYQTSETTASTANSGPLTSRTSYNDLGDTILKISAAGQRTQIDYDGFRRQITIWGEDPNSAGLLKLETYSYLAQNNGQNPPTVTIGGFLKTTRTRPQFTTPEADFIETREFSDPYDRPSRFVSIVQGKTLIKSFEFNNQDQSSGGLPGTGLIARKAVLIDGKEVQFLAYAYNKEEQVSAISTLLPGQSGEQPILEFTYDLEDNSVSTFSFDPSTEGSFDRANPVTVGFGGPFGNQARKKITRNGSRTTFTYTPFGEIASITDGLAQSINYQYNVFGQIIARQSDNNDGAWTYGYDVNGNLTQIDEPRGKYHTLLVYDALNRIHIKTVTLTSNPNIVVSTDHYEFDCFLTGFTNCQGKIAQHTFAQSDEQGFVTDQVTQQLSYDEYGLVATRRHIVEVEDGEAVTNTAYVNSYVHFPNAYVEIETYPNGYVRTVSLDIEGLVSNVNIVDTAGKELARVNYTEFDLTSGDYTRMEAANGIVQIRTFDSLNRIQSNSVETADGTVLGAETDIVRNKNGLTFSRKVNNGTLISNEAYGYDTMGFLANATSDNPRSSFQGGIAQQNGLIYTYDIEGNRLTLKKGLVTANYTYVFNRPHRLQRFQRIVRGATSLVNLVYDGNGNMTSKTGRLFSYNASNQIVQVTDSSGAFEMAAFYVDNKRIMKREKVTMDPDDTVASITTRYLGNYQIALGYDSDLKGFAELHTIQMPSLQATPVIITLNGDTLTLVGQVQSNSAMQWASAHDATQILGAIGAAKNYASAFYQHPKFLTYLQWAIVFSILIFLFGYFVLIRRRIEPSSHFKNRLLTWITWIVLFAFNIQLISPVLAAVVPGPNGPGYEELSGDPTVNYQFANTLNSIMVTTDVTGKRLNYLTYLPFGALDITASDGIDITRGKFNGKEFDEAAGLAYFGSRYYDPETGRFATEDPADQFASPYRYGLQPIDGSDPTGEAFFVPIFIVGLIIGTLSEVALIAVEHEWGAIKNYNQSQKVAITMFAWIGMAISIAMMQGPIRVATLLHRAGRLGAYRTAVNLERQGVREAARGVRQAAHGRRGGGGVAGSRDYAYYHPILARGLNNIVTGAGRIANGQTAQRQILYRTNLVLTETVGGTQRKLFIQFAQDVTQNFVLFWFGNGYYEGTFNPQEWTFDANSWAPLASWAAAQTYNLRALIGERVIRGRTLFRNTTGYHHIYAQGIYSFGAALIGYRGKGDRGIVDYDHGDAIQVAFQGFVFGGFWGGLTTFARLYKFNFLKLPDVSRFGTSLHIAKFATWGITLNGPIKLAVGSGIGANNFTSDADNPIF